MGLQPSDAYFAEGPVRPSRPSAGLGYFGAVGAGAGTLFDRVSLQRRAGRRARSIVQLLPEMSQGDREHPSSDSDKSLPQAPAGLSRADTICCKNRPLLVTAQSVQNRYGGPGNSRVGDSHRAFGPLIRRNVACGCLTGYINHFL
jgi:hypothetical protein